MGGLRTGSSTVITFSVDVPRTGDYRLSIFDGSDSAASDVSGPTNVFVRVNGGSPQEVWLPVGYNWVIWNHADTTVHLTAGAHQISLSTTGADGASTNGDAIINQIELQLDDPAVTGPAVYEAEQASLDGATTDYRAQGQSGAGAADIAPGQSVTFWVYSAADGYSDLAFRYKSAGTAGVTVNTLPLAGQLSGAGLEGWSTGSYRVYLSAGINKVVVRGDRGEVVLDKLTVTPLAAASAAAAANVVTYQAEDGTLAGTAKVDSSYSQAHGGVVTGISDGPANSLTLAVHAPVARQLRDDGPVREQSAGGGQSLQPGPDDRPGRHQHQRRPQFPRQLRQHVQLEPVLEPDHPGAAAAGRQHHQVHRQPAVQLRRQDHRGHLFGKRDRAAAPVRHGAEHRPDHPGTVPASGDTTVILPGSPVPLARLPDTAGGTCVE